MRALVIGGTGPTGPFIVNGLLERGYDVSVLNRGVHDTPEIPAHVERIVGDPHFVETLSDALSGCGFDLCIATYGRIRHVADVMRAHTDRLITVGGSPGVRGSRQPHLLFPEGQQIPTPETAETVRSEEEFKFGYLARISEERVFDHHESGHYAATHFRYPLIYGPRQLRPAEWGVIRRILDGRKHIVLPDGGLTLLTRGYSANMAHAVLLAVDQPEASAGELYNCGDVQQLTLAQWVQVIAHSMDVELEVLSVPGVMAYGARELMIARKTSHHQLFDLHKLRHQLGYTDQTPVVEALTNTVQFYVDNPPNEELEARARRERQYLTEDAMANIVRQANEALAAVEFEDPVYRHPYAHPKQPGSGKDEYGR